MLDKKKKLDHKEETYFVESILEGKISKKKKLFLVSWKYYSVEEATWEPEENIPSFIIKVEC